MSGDTVVMLISATACLFLAARALKVRNLSFEKKAAMAAAWIAIIAALAFVISRLHA